MKLNFTTVKKPKGPRLSWKEITIWGNRHMKTTSKMKWVAYIFKLIISDLMPIRDCTKEPRVNAEREVWPRNYIGFQWLALLTENTAQTWRATTTRGINFSRANVNELWSYLPVFAMILAQFQTRRSEGSGNARIWLMENSFNNNALTVRITKIVFIFKLFEFDRFAICFKIESISLTIYILDHNLFL